MQQQKTFDFDAKPAAPEAEHVETTTSLPPPALPIRPDRQVVYPDAVSHYDWPSAEELHDRDTITVDRVIDSERDGPAHRFVIKRGDTVNTFLSSSGFLTGTVVGISHAENQVRVSHNGDPAKGQWWNVGSVYPAKEPKPVSVPNAAPLSEVVSLLNDKHEPEGGWTDAEKVPEPYTFVEFKELWGRGLTHDSFAEYRADFERLVASRDAVIEELQATYKAPKLKALASRMGDWNASRNTKPANAKSIFEKMLGSFSFGGFTSYGMDETYEQAVTKRVRAVTEEDWNAHKQESAAKLAEHEAALVDPQNLADFAKFIDAKGVEKLTNEQMARWDAMHADLARVRRAENGPATTVTRFESEELEGIEFTIKEGYHDRKECPLWIVQLGSRVEKETFRELKGKAKMLGGWWSSFKKTDAGFQFYTEEAATRFTDLLSSDADREDILTARKERKELTAAERLHELAETLTARADETIESSHASLQNTARRASIQEGVRGRAYADQALARSLHSVAESLSTGEATYLDGVRHKTHLETLDTVLYLAKWARIRAIRKADSENEYGYGMRVQEEEEKPFSDDDIRFTEYPEPTIYKRHLEDAVLKCRELKGAKLSSERMRKRIGRTSSEMVTFRGEHDIAELADFLSRAKSAGYDTQWMDASLEKYKRLQAAKIGDIHELRSALREYLPHKASVRGDDPVQIAERELIGKKLPGFFPTPQPVIEELLEYAGIADGHTVLEPSCGKGDIVQAIGREAPGAQVTAIEQNRTLADVLSTKGIAAQFADFLEHDGSYDRVVMNPPFEKGQDIDHVRHAYELLASGGRLVSVMSEGPFYRSDAKATEFRQWADALGAESYELPEDAFKGTDAFRQTGVRTRLFVADKA